MSADPGLKRRPGAELQDAAARDETGAVLATDGRRPVSYVLTTRPFSR